MRQCCGFIRMDKTGSASTLAPKTMHRQFFQWAIKWFYAKSPENVSTTYDFRDSYAFIFAADKCIQIVTFVSERLPAPELINLLK